MFLSLSILLLLLFVLGFWLVKESRVSIYLKIFVITLFFSFCVIMHSSLESSLGWAVDGRHNMPKIVTLRHVVIREPNEQLHYEGSIYFLIDMPPTSYDSLVLKVFGHKSESTEPRLYRLPYNRRLHESLQKDVIPKLQRGQSVTGKFIDGNEEGDGDDEGDSTGGSLGNGKGGKKGKGHGKKRQRGQGQGQGGGGSDSLEQNDTMFYELPPSYFQEKH